MGCNCKKKGNSKGMDKSMSVKNFKKNYSRPDKKVISLSENDLKNLINKVIKETKK
tara:strand:+ start:958 stop:1125 length:168 start_codon:yes stop_codon:yes gene_type:complete